MRRASFELTVGGVAVSARVAPILLGLTVTDRAGTHADTASVEIDDTDGRVILPRIGAPVSVAIGWSGAALRRVFSGVVDEVRSAGSRAGGRSLSIQARGVDTAGRAKQGQARHFDQRSVAQILREAGAFAGIAEVDVDPALASVIIPYLDMRDESFLHLGERLARELGGSFRVAGARAVLSRRSGGYTPTVEARAGVNLQSWEIAPAVGRTRYQATVARTYDPALAAEVTVGATVGVDQTAAALVRRELLGDEAAARRAADGDAAAAREAAGGGTVVIEGNADAVPDGLCLIVGARPGIDGAYRIRSVTHSITRDGGWSTSLDVAEPQGTAGSDAR